MMNPEQQDTDLTEAKERAQAEGESAGLARRDFLSILSASFAALGLSACEFRAPKEKVVPYMQEPESAKGGVANWYASTCRACPASCGTLVKTRDGRPIKLEGNPEHPLSRGGLCARGQAAVLDLYDSQRLKGPLMGGERAQWERVDAAIGETLTKIKAAGGQIRIVSPTVASPSLGRALGVFKQAFPTARLVTCDSLPASAILEAHATTHGVARLPRYRFDRARLIVSLDADFLGTWVSPVEFTRAWSEGRVPTEQNPAMSRHVHFESRMSVTGANADRRFAIAPSQMAAVAIGLARRLGERLGVAEVTRLAPAPASATVASETLDSLADELASARGECLIVCGSADEAIQTTVNLMNHWLGNYGRTLDLTRPALVLGGRRGEMEELLGELERGEVAALLFVGSNPGYHHPRAEALKKLLPGVELTISLAGLEDETAELCTFVCPDHHPLESWGDAHPAAGVYTLLQPSLAPLYETRAATESLLAWAGAPASAYDHLRKTWEEQIFALQSEHSDFEAFWTRSVHDGVLEIENESLAPAEFDPSSIEKIHAADLEIAPGELELVAYASVALGDGAQANNPWLQELPDPIGKTTWGNFAALAPATASGLGAAEGQVARLTSSGRSIELPVQIQPGMAEGVVALALGYGRKNAGKIAANYPVEKMFPIEKELLGGADVYPFVGVRGVKVELTGRFDPLAKTQTYDYQVVPFTGENREQIRETTLAEFARGSDRAEKEHSEHESLWPDHEYEGHHWTMAIDLARCTGCSACVVACRAENNVPVVGKVEVRKKRHMDWIRLDRYYSGSPDANESNPEVAFQPMLCQHCDHAPCETVCPVLATVHSAEGLNMQVYNRCVGTKYCANNCPYKVRRFNWFDYAHEDLTQNLVLNPDVTVRERGVMEKCSFCVQRINEVKSRARAEGREPADGEIMPACAQSCPASAIFFGDSNDPESRVAGANRDRRAYGVLEDLGTRPSVQYLKKVRNKQT